MSLDSGFRPNPEEEGEKSMKYLFRFLLLMITSLSLAACIQVETLVKVKPDGSGTVEETFMMKKELLRQMEQMMEAMAKGMAEMMTEEEKGGESKKAPEPRAKAETFDFFNEAKLKENARKMGEGVTFLSGSKIVTDDFEGYKAIYTFEDINKLKINQNPGEKISAVPQGNGSDIRNSKKENIIFTFRKGTPAELIIRLPRSTANAKSKTAEDAGPAQNTEKPSEEAAAQAKELFQGMRIALSVAVDGTIVETNATYREGSRITLLAVDFGKLTGMPELFRKFTESNLNSLEESKELMKQIPGMQVDYQEEIRIQYK
jgi:hypothetical protein